MGELVLENPCGNVGLNIGGTHNMLEIARQFEIPKVVYTSTGAVYGAVSGTVAEDQYPPNPCDLYGSTKASSEFLGQQYANSFGFEFRISRAREGLGFEPKYSVEEGIKKYADWMKKVMM